MTTGTPEVLRIELGERGYPIVIGDGLLDDGELLQRHVAARDVLVVTNTTVGPLYAGRLAAVWPQAAAGRRLRTIELPDGERFKTLEVLGRVFDAMVDSPPQPRCLRRRARRRRRRRHGRLCRRLLPARRRLRAGADDAAGAGRLVRRRQDRRQPPGRQEPDRRLPPAARRAVRPRHPAHAAATGIARRPRRGDQVRPDRRSAFLAWIEDNLDPLLALDPAALGARGAALVRDQGAHRRRGRARAGPARAAEPRPHLRPCDRDRRRLRRMAARRGGRRWACCWPPTCRSASAGSTQRPSTASHALLRARRPARRGAPDRRGSARWS